MRVLAYCGIMVAAVSLSTLSRTSAKEQEGFTPLFNGKDLTGWSMNLRDAKDPAKPNPDPKTVWTVQDGSIHCAGRPNGYLATEKEYGNYVLRLKWRWPAGSKGGNSGVLLHVQEDTTKDWPTSVEAQLAAGSAGDFWLIYPPKATLDVDQSRQDPKQARHYFRIGGKEKKVEKEIGEWNQYEITSQDGNVTLRVNGELVNEGKNGNLKKGRIGLQSEGTAVEFREIEIKETK